MTLQSSAVAEPATPLDTCAPPDKAAFKGRLSGHLQQVTAPRHVALICGLAFVLRLLISATTHGSDDVDAWNRFSKLILRIGVLRTYEVDSTFNHPPIMGWYGAAAKTLAIKVHLHFDVAFRLLPILASTATVFMVHRIGRLNWKWLLLFAVNPTDVLISAYHGNTDAICAAFCVASVLCADRDRPWASGFLLGAAMNVKLIPVVLIAPLMCSFPRRAMWRFCAALSLCALPFLPIALGPWRAFKENAIDYNSYPSPWGVGLIDLALDGRLESLSQRFGELTLAFGKPLILCLSVLLGLVQLVSRMFSRAELCAIAFSCFLVAAPGFGVQYLLYPTAFFAVILARRGFRYIYLAGALTFFIYFNYWTGSGRTASHFDHEWDLRSVLAGFLAWAWLTQYLLRVARRVIARLRRIGVVHYGLRVVR